ncbi:MAG TPA: methionine ABC transporter permease [Candidatus Deferrimicrobium sp.]|nr:methionine ABC transporter permease [Candidatus Deferrimicrobium sp.]
MFNDPQFWQNLWELLGPAIGETLYMTAVAVVLSYVCGIPLGIILVTTDKGHILENLPVNKVLGAIVNVFRSVPFIILMVALIPFTRAVVGSSIGTTAAIVPLVISATPFVARLVETSLKEVPWGVIEASLAMGASPWQIIFKVLLPEARSSLVLGFAITTISIVGYTAMAGAIGGGGLGDLAIRYGYNRFRTDIMIATVVILVILVQVIQSLGDNLAAKINRK